MSDQPATPHRHHQLVRRVNDDTVNAASQAYLAARYPDATANANRVRPQTHQFAMRAALTAALSTVSEDLTYELGRAYWLLATYASICSLAGYRDGRVLSATLNLAFVALWIVMSIRTYRRAGGSKS